MKSIQTWLEEYGVSHQNPTNKLIHWICVPTIFFTIVGLFYSIKFPFYLTPTFQLNGAVIALTVVFIYYVLLSRTLAVGMLLFSLICLAIAYFIESAVAGTAISLWMVCVTLFVIAWIGQFYGHNVEGMKPSFLKDLQFLMIGPAWLLSFIYKKLGISL
jgi:uncharacterized membrane protein YGL010W